MCIVSNELPSLVKLQLPGQGRGRGGRGRGGPPPSPAIVDDSFIHYAAPINFMFQSNGLSAIDPPWSQLTAYGLNTGTIDWQVPDGGITALEEHGHGDTGAHVPRGGPVTAGGLIFVATAFGRKIRAYDEDTGKVDPG